MLGIVIISTKHPNYGRLAYNLALSIKATENVQIAIVKDDVALSHLTDEQKKFFDQIIDLPEHYGTGFQTKLHLDQLTPFDKTLYLDADMVWVGYKKPSELFKELNGISFTGITEGDNIKPNPKYYFWADLKEIQDQYKVDKVYQWRSEVLYFEKGTKVFKKARELKPEKKLKTIRMFGPYIPDELYFNIATAILGVEPHKKWMPAYWLRMNNDVMPKPGDLANGYYLLSAGSNWASNQMKKMYDNTMRVVTNKLKVPYLFPLKSKKEWAPGRLKI